MRITTKLLLIALLLGGIQPCLLAQDDPSLLTIDRIFASSDFRGEYFQGVRWMDDGESYSTLERGPEGLQLVRVDIRSGEKEVLVNAKQLTPKGADRPLAVANYEWSHDKQKLLIFTNTRRVWRANTRGDYWVLNLRNNKLKQLGEGLPEASLMFTKFDAGDKRVSYVSGHNVYVEEVSSGQRTALTDNGSEDLINGTFDWAYEEEFFCRDGFRWSPDGSMIAYWQIDASEIRDFMMINNTDSTYSFLIPVEYPKVGETPSSCRIGIVDAKGGETHWLNIPGDPRQNYLPRMLWADDSKHVMVQQVNRKQNTLKVWWCDVETGEAKNVYTDQDEAWIDVVDGVRWLDEGKAFSWVSQKGGWKQLYKVGLDGTETLLTPGEYDMISLNAWNGNDLYITASPDDPTQRYLYHINLKNKKKEPKRISPKNQAGTHSYQIAPGGKYAVHSFSNANTPPTTELVSLPDHKVIRTLVANQKLKKAISELKPTPVEFFQITTEDGVTMEGYQMFPADFDRSKRYPVLFYVYSEPAGQTARDAWGGRNGLWHRMLAQQGYLVISLDNRGTPAPKGRAWRKAIYQKIGIVNIRDQGMAVKEILKWPYVDANRIAAWGWSGGGSCTLNLLFQWSELYQTGMSVAPVANQLYYDNIYQERYMGLPQEEMEPFVQGSPITHAKNLQGNLLLIHGTGDDNVHYQNSEALINELIKHNKQFQVMPYPNRSHGIYEGANTSRHLYTLMTNYLMEHTPPGGVEQ
jgi:dipeptidyl-peptidase-4